MKTAVTRTLLRHLGNMIDHGQPIWAMLWANEYKEELGDLHPALRTKARRKLFELMESEFLPAHAQELFDQALRESYDKHDKIELRAKVQKIEQCKLPIQKKVTMFNSGRTQRFVNLGIGQRMASRRRG